MIFARTLGNAFKELLEKDPRTVILGEDISDPYGGAFKVTRGLSTAFPDRVRSTPVSEGAITGVSAGLAMAGFRPITEIMFGDFMGLCFDQILNHISKYEAMYNGRVSCPVVMRAPSGGGRGYGPTHSQSLEKYFLGIPHLRVAAASLYHDPLETFRFFLSQDSPVFYTEHKMLYPMEMSVPVNGTLNDLMAAWYPAANGLPTLSLAPVGREDCALTLLAYGYQASVAEKIIHELAVEDEIFVELLVPGELRPMSFDPIVASVNQTGQLITIEEGTAGNSWGTEVASVIQKRCFGKLKRSVEVLTSDASIIPSAKHLEDRMLINKDRVIKTIRKMTR